MRFSERSSPVLVLPQSSAFNMDRNPPSFNSPFNYGADPCPTASSNLTPTSIAPQSRAGRKRSRDEAAENLEEDYFAVQEPVKEPENEEEWVYGPGMTLIKPNKGYIMEASSQTGTWAEEQEEKEKALAAQAAQQLAERPILRAAKSLRLDMTATPLCDESSSVGASSAPSPERSSYVEPTVDDFTRHLGIGWSSLSSDSDIQAAVRGWSRFIENHFAVTNAKIRLQSRGLASYLVEADQGFFLFAEDLKKGQLVSTDLQKTWANLSSPIPVFEGEAVMEAVGTPRIAVEPTFGASNTFNNGMTALDGSEVVVNGGHVPTTHIAEVEMDIESAETPGFVVEATSGMPSTFDGTSITTGHGHDVVVNGSHVSTTIQPTEVDHMDMS